MQQFLPAEVALLEPAVQGGFVIELLLPAMVDQGLLHQLIGWCELGSCLFHQLAANQRVQEVAAAKQVEGVRTQGGERGLDGWLEIIHGLNLARLDWGFQRCPSVGKKRGQIQGIGLASLEASQLHVQMVGAG
jgi:hypothetical protein